MVSVLRAIVTVQRGTNEENGKNRLYTTKDTTKMQFHYRWHFQFSGKCNSATSGAAVLTESTEESS
jgi:hypothetical protein